MTNVEKIQVGNNQVAFVRKEGQVIWPQYTGRENLVLWYDFIGRRNTDTKRGIAEDLSGNGNNGALNGFGYIEGSGYNDGLVFDGVDDYINITTPTSFPNGYTFTVFLNSINVSLDHEIAGSSSASHPALRLTNNGSYLRIQFVRSDATTALITLDMPLGVLDSSVGITVVYNVLDSKIEVYVNAVKITDRATTLSPNNWYRYIGRRTSVIRLGAKVFSARAYSKALTPSEIQTNYLIDKQRFNLP